MNAISSKQAAVEKARQFLAQDPLYLDTETTGIDRNDGIVEIAVVDDLGKVIFDSLVRPLKPIPADVTRIHHITNEMVKSAPNWAVVWARLRPLLVGRLILTYNAEFDLRMFQQTHTQHGLRWSETPATMRFDCIMKLYARFRGDWDERRNDYRYHSLDAAGKYSSISLPNSHRAADDTLLARALLHSIAETEI